MIFVRVCPVIFEMISERYRYLLSLKMCGFVSKQLVSVMTVEFEFREVSSGDTPCFLGDSVNSTVSGSMLFS